jgi:hypothetical protein
MPRKERRKREIITPQGGSIELSHPVKKIVSPHARFRREISWDRFDEAGMAGSRRRLLSAV